MKRMIQTFFVIPCLLVSSFSQLRGNDWEYDSPQRTISELTARIDDPLTKLTAMRDKLIDAQKKYVHKTEPGLIDLLPKALKRIDAASEAAGRDPAGTETQQTFQAAWFMTKAAYIQLMIADSKGQAQNLQVDMDAVLKRMDAVRDSIQIYKPEGVRAAEAIAQLFEFNSDVIKVKNIDRGTVVSISDILFEVGQASLTDNLRTNLDRIVAVLKQSAADKIVIEGHTDNTGSDDSNRALSEARAKAVMKYFVSKGIPSVRLSAKGYGASRPVAGNDTDDGRRQNRRVDLVIEN